MDIITRPWRNFIGGLTKASLNQGIDEYLHAAPGVCYNTPLVVIQYTDSAARHDWRLPLVGKLLTGLAAWKPKVNMFIYTHI